MDDQSLVLLHGQPGSGSDWQPVLDLLAPSVRAMALDRPGYRSSPHPAGDFEANARVVLAEMDTAGIEQAVVIGHSYGGGVALSLAVLAPERVSALVLVASIGPGCLTTWDTLLAAPIAGAVCAITAWWLTPWFARARLARIERLRNRPLEDDEFVNWAVWARAHHEHGAVWRTFLIEQRALVRGLDHLTGQIPSITAPVMIMADRGDTLVPVETARALHGLLPQSTLRLFDSGGHHLPRRSSAAVAGAIEEFLARL